jgi:hypothetical protein
MIITREKFRFRPSIVALGIALGFMTISSIPVRTQQPVAQLSPSDVLAVLRASAEAIDDNTMAIAVVDRRARILGVYARPGAARFSWDAAVTVARTAALFSNGQAPLPTQTIRTISGIHFPPGVPNVPSGALYGIESSNRGCQLTTNANQPFERSKSIAGLGLLGGGELPCRANDTRGCALGGPILGPGSSGTVNIGINTGKNDIFDIADEPLNVSVNKGGYALYRSGHRRCGRHAGVDRSLRGAVRTDSGAGRRVHRRHSSAVLHRLHQCAVRARQDCRGSAPRRARLVQSQ